MSFFRDIGRILSKERMSETGNALSDMNIYALDSEDALQNALSKSEQEPVVIFKHSNMCAISAMARRRILSLTEADDPPVFELVVQNSRPISQKLEQDFGIRHESPQVILVHKQQPTYHTSHSMITTDAIRSAVADAIEKK